MARAAEIYERTLEIVAEKVYNEQNEIDFVKHVSNFTYDDLLSPVNLELLANLSGCLSHRRHVNCSQDICTHRKFRTIDGSCNNLQNPLWGSSLTSFKRLLPAQYENHFNTPRGMSISYQFVSFFAKNDYIPFSISNVLGWERDKLYNGFKLPSARKVSNEVISTSKTTADDQISHMVMQFGQFLDHDMDHSMEAISTQNFENGIFCSAT